MYLRHNLQLTLDEMYVGAERHLVVLKDPTCVTCQGTGSAIEEPKNFQTCEICSETGNMSTNDDVTRVCKMCWGQGVAIAYIDRCATCNGSGVHENNVLHDVNVARGSRHGQKIIIKSGGIHEPNKRPGDVYVVLQALHHPVFTRKGDDLFMKMELQLVESLCGFIKFVEMPDQRIIKLVCRPGKVVQNYDTQYVDGEGMPTFRNPKIRGRLYLCFTVNMPGRIPTKFVKTIEQCLPERETVEIPEGVKECNLVSKFDVHIPKNL